MWGWLASLLTGPLFSTALSAWKAKLASQDTATQAAGVLAARELDVQQREFEVQAALRTAEIGHAWEPDKLFAYVVLAFFAKVVVWDTMLGLGSTPALRGDAATWAGWIVSLYVGRRGVENVARIWKR